MGIVYIATSKTSGKSYIGQTSRRLKDRLLHHKGDAKAGKSQSPFHQAIRLYGLEDFEWSILFESANREWLFLVERHMIKSFGTKTPQGYNISDGGKSGAAGVPQSEQTRNKRSRSLKGKNKGKTPWLGRKQTEEAKAKMSAKRKGRQLTPEWRAKISANCAHEVTEQERIKRSRARGGCSVVCLEDGKLFPYQLAAARHYNIPGSHISNHLSGKQSHCRGLHFQRVDA